MQKSKNPPTVINVTAAELREYIQTHHEAEFALIDVRQREEYAAGHIPGSRLMPLNELEANARDLEPLSNRRVVFYCRGGARSARASAWASQSLHLPQVYNLLGGFMGWEGPNLVDFPRLERFEPDGSMDALLRQAFELEKGTHRFYAQVVAEHRPGPIVDTLSQLVSAELAHGAAVYRLLAQPSPGSRQTFEEAFAEAPGKIIENGASFDEVLGRARALGSNGDMALLELALEIEFGAYDLYKNLEATAPSVEAKQMLNELAQQEKGHGELILRAIGSMASSLGGAASGH